MDLWACVRCCTNPRKADCLVSAWNGPPGGSTSCFFFNVFGGYADSPGANVKSNKGKDCDQLRTQYPSESRETSARRQPDTRARNVEEVLADIPPRHSEHTLLQPIHLIGSD